MIKDSSWDDETYAQVFEQVCSYVMQRRSAHTDFTFDDLRGMLDAAYQRRGMDWIGRGHLFHVIDSATIAAFEHMLAEWEKERKTRE